jgi:hypothetical protein
MTARQLKYLSIRRASMGLAVHEISHFGWLLLMLDMLSSSVQASVGYGFWPKYRAQKSHMGAMGMYGSHVEKFDLFGRAN